MHHVNLLIVPGSPALVSELAPRDDSGQSMVAVIKDVLDVLREQGDDSRPIEIVGSQDARWRTGLTGSFHAWGAEVTVGGGNYLPELVARYCLGPHEHRIGGAKGSRARLLPLNTEALTVVVVDGSAGVTQRAPLAYVEGARETHCAMGAFLNGEGPLPSDLEGRGVLEPALWEELAALTPTRCELLAEDNHLGVGRFVAAWEV